MTPETPPDSLMGSTPEKITSLHHLFEEQEIPYAISGALALGYYKRARGTIDIDVGIFLPPEDHERVLAALAEVFPVPNPDEFRRTVKESQQGHTYWGNTRIDLFFSATEFEVSMAERARTVPFNGSEIRIISAEDLLVCKAMMTDSKHWVDIEDVCKYLGSELDTAYIDTWVRAFGEDDPRVKRMEELFQKHIY
jgi:hypothetical protein